MAQPGIRAARASDLPALVEIYNHYVLRTPVTFDIEPSTVESRRAWFQSFSDTGPHQLLVAEVGDSILGYASSSRHRPKPAYDRSVETTIYLGPDQAGRGVGQQLYGALIERLEAVPGVHRAFAGIALPNPSSVALHEKLGFRLIGSFGEIGFKFDRYWDVEWYERSLETTSL